MEIYGEVVRDNAARGLLIVNGGYVRLTDKGIDWSNKVMSEFL